jgi:uncharacterized 2Fe-2S/4Fe-4S cluster protein (DUF4445 family)
MAISFHSNGRTGTTDSRVDALLAELAAEAGFPLNMQCGGQGACRGCIVRLGPGSYRIGGTETVVGEGETLEARACKTTVLSAEATVDVPARSLLSIGSCSSADFYTEHKIVFEGSENGEGTLGIAVDIGTTTVAALLVDLSSGKILARESAYNRQIELGTDVAARIALCCEAENVEKLRRLIIDETLVPMVANLSKTSSQSLENVTEVTFSGNTVMSHLALGLSALSIGTIPFEPLTKVFREHAAPEIGLTCCPNARVRIVPAISGYVGGDIVSDLYTCVPTDSGIELIVDIGTNGEIVLNDHGKWIATATAAGPAFEGAGLLHGCRADDGVIEEIICNPDDSIDVKVIGSRPPRGLCGSAAIDFMATAFQTGLLNTMGRFDLDRLRAAGRLDVLEGHGMKVNACVIVPKEESALDEPVMITEFDVSQILKAKGAVYAGIRTLLARAGYGVSDLDRLVLAGGFAAHLRLEHAMTVGLLPEMPLEKVDVIGNGSLAGAYAALGSPTVFDELLNISQKPAALHLNECAEFNDRYIDAMALPNLDPDEFPSVAAGR